MSYLVLARRWRPQRFGDLVGQDVVIQTLRNALSSNHLAHAYLLCGIRGVGKTTIARLMAMAVNCEQPQQGEPCGQCAACKGVVEGSNLDVQEMDAASHTGVDDVREILDGVRYPPSSLKYKVYIIDEAHMLSKSAFNALLKTLEEPPEHVLFILATTEADKLPVTVRSRCQRFDLRQLSQQEICDYLRHIFTEESLQADEGALAAIARAADGSVRDALSLAERVLAFDRGCLTREHVHAALGLMGSELLCAISEALFQGKAAVVVAQLRAAISRGFTPRLLLMELSRLWHQLACMQVDQNLLEQSSGEDMELRAWLQHYASMLTAQALDLRYQVLIAGIRDLALVDERMGAEMLLMRLCGLQLISPITITADAKGDGAVAMDTKKIEHSHVSSMSEKQPEKTVRDVEHAVEKAPDLPLQSPNKGKQFSTWQQAVEAYSAIKPGFAARLEHVACVEFGDRVVRLAIEPVQRKAMHAADCTAFSDWLGRRVLWNESKEGAGVASLAAQREQEVRAEEQRLRRNAERDPHVHRLMQEVGAELVKVLPPGVDPDANE